MLWVMTGITVSMALTLRNRDLRYSFIISKMKNYKARNNDDHTHISLLLYLCLNLNPSAYILIIIIYQIMKWLYLLALIVVIGKVENKKGKSMKKKFNIKNLMTPKVNTYIVIMLLIEF
jgi:hypothetical protein